MRRAGASSFSSDFTRSGGELEEGVGVGEFREGVRLGVAEGGGEVLSAAERGEDGARGFEARGLETG